MVEHEAVGGYSYRRMEAGEQSGWMQGERMQRRLQGDQQEWKVCEDIGARVCNGGDVERVEISRRSLACHRQAETTDEPQAELL